MPYIKQEDRSKKQELASNLADECKSVGDLNYSISVLMHRFLESKGKNYTNINSLIGVLECAKLELYRVIAAPYEDTKIEENGPVSELDGV